MTRDEYINAKSEQLLHDLRETLSMSRDELTEYVHNEICIIHNYRLINPEFSGVYQDFDPDYSRETAQIIVENVFDAATLD